MPSLTPELITVLMFLTLLIGIFIGIPLGFVLGGIGVIFGFLIMGMDATLSMFMLRIFGTMNNYVLVSIPLFIFMAQCLAQSGVADDMFDAVRYLFGPVRGGLAIAVVTVSTVLAACSGITGAACVTMSMLGLPVMLKAGYDKKLACGSITGSSALGILIPPSIMLVVMAEQTGLTVGTLFAGAIIPGIILSALFIIYILIKCYFVPEAGPALSKEERAKVSTKQIALLLLKSMVPPIILIFGVLGAIFFGIATPTEAAGTGAFLAFLMVIAYGRFSLSGFYDMVMTTTRSSSMVLVVMVGATCFTGVFMASGGGDVVKDFILGLGLGKWGTYIVMMIILFLMGMFLDWIAIVMLTFPVFLPMAVELGFNKLWFVVSVAVMLQDSFITPPFGYNLFYMKGCAPPEISMGDIIKGSFPFWKLMEVGLIIVCIFPQTITWLPSILVK